MRAINNAVEILKPLPHDIAHYIVKEFIHTLSMEECVRDHGAVLEFVVSHPEFEKSSVNKVMVLACEYGHVGLVEFMITKGANDWNQGLYGACYGGHMEMAELMIEKGANDWNCCLWSACRGGQVEMAELMISKGATNWDWSLWGARLGGHMKMVELMISKGAIDWHWIV